MDYIDDDHIDDLAIIELEKRHIESVKEGIKEYLDEVGSSSLLRAMAQEKIEELEADLEEMRNDYRKYKDYAARRLLEIYAKERKEQIARLKLYTMTPVERAIYEESKLPVDKARQYPITNLLPMKRKGSVWVALCPFHKEKTPSFTVYPDNHFKCFGCGRYGDVIDVYMVINNCGFKQAVLSLTNGSL